MEQDIKSLTRLGVLRMIFIISPLYTTLRIFLTIVGGLVSSGLLALSVAKFVDTALAIIESGGPKSDVYPSLIVLLVVLGLYETVESVVKMVDAKIRLDITMKIKPLLVKTQSSLEFKHIENDISWELITRVMRDPAAALVDGFGAYILILQIVISVVSVLGLLITNVWWAALIIVAFSIPLFKLSLYAGKKNYKAGQDSEKFNRRTEYLDNVLTGRDNIEERTLFGYGDELSANWQDQYETGRKLQLNVALRQFITMKASSLILAMISLLIALTLVNPVITGRLTIGLFTGIVSSVFGIINKLAAQMSDAMERVSRIHEYMKELDILANMSQTKDALVTPQSQVPAFESLEFKNVRFRYPSGENMILNGLNFKLEKGRHYAFVGKNGAGKSTLTKLMTGLYTDYEGEILINGKELRSYPLGEVKAMFSIVYQDFAKYSVSLRDNIALGNVNEMKSGNVETTAEAAGIGDIVAELKNGLDTHLGKIHEDGQELSGGQWQRVAVARSLFSNAAVRILDEPTSALDPIRESEVYQEFEKLMKDKTTIFISHRLGSTKLADEILVIDEGTVAERGTHDELMAAAGIYAQMYESQRSWYQ